MFDHLELVDLAQKAAGDEVATCSDDDLLAAALSMECAMRALAAASGHLLAELESRGTCLTEFGMSTAKWLAHHRAQPIGAAKRRVHAATVLRTRLGDVDEALSTSRIDPAHVDVFVRAANPRIVDEVAKKAPEWLDRAEGTSFEQFRRETMAEAERLDHDGGYDPRRDRNQNRLRLSPFGDGTFALDGQLVGDLGVSVRDALNAEADRLFRQFRTDHLTSGGEIEIPDRSTLLALALGELCRKGLVTDISSTSGPVTDLTVVLHADDPSVVHTLDGEIMRRDHLECRLCDAAFRFLSLDDDGAPLKLGYEQRLASRHQRRANAVRDGGCVFPGCDAPPAWTDQHHVVRPDDGGPTDVENLASLCRTHHGITHRKGWEMHATDDQWFWWRTPGGRTFWSQRHHRQRAGPTPDG